MDRFRQRNLTKKHLEEVVQVANANLSEMCSTERQRLDMLEGQLADVDARLAKLYDALETREFKGGELAPRLKVLFQKKEDLLSARTQAEEALRGSTIQLADPQVVQGYVNEMRVFLESSGIVERKAFLKSFVKRIEVDETEATVVYTIPMLPDDPIPGREAVGVLPFVHDGPP